MTITEPQQAPDTSNGAQGAVSTPSRHWTGVSGDAPWVASARELVPQLRSTAAHHDRTGRFVAPSIAHLRDHGFMQLLVPEALGGGGSSHAEACAVLAELAHGCPATSLVYSMHSHLVAAQVWRHRHELPAPVLGKVAAKQLMLISTGAADWLGSSGTARKVDGGFVVTARKMPASGCPAGDVLATSIRWDEAPDGPQVIHCSVPFSAEGVSIDETWDAMGMRGTGSHTVVLEDVFVPDESVALIRPAGVWHPIWSVVLGAALPLIMATYVGVAESAVERTLQCVSERAERPHVAPLVGRMLNRLTVARDTVRAMIDEADDLNFDNTVDLASRALVRKSNAAGACIDTVRLAMEIGGGATFARSGEIERLLRDVSAAEYHPLPSAQQERFTGRIAVGLDPLEER